MDILKKAETIKRCGITSLIWVFFVIICAVMRVIWPHIWWRVIGPYISLGGSIHLLFLFLMLGFIALSFIFNIISAIMILSTDWKNNDLNSQKIAWGILCIVILGSIAAIIFGSIAINKLKETSSISNNKEENNKTIEEIK